MRILFTIHDFLPAAVGGSELYTYYLARGVQSAGHDVHLLYREPSKVVTVERRQYEGLPSTVLRGRYNYATRWYGEESNAEGEEAFSGLLEEFAPDVVHVNHLLGLSLGIPGLARRAGVPVVFTLHDYWMHCLQVQYVMPGDRICSGPSAVKCAQCWAKQYSPYALSRRARTIRERFGALKRWVLLKVVEQPKAIAYFKERAAQMRRMADDVSVFVAPSRFLAETLIRDGLDRTKVVYCDYGMDTSLFTHRPERERRARLKFGFVGTISELKGVDVLLEAARGLEVADIVIYGRENPELFGKYRDVLGQPNVTYGGILRDADKARTLGQLDALIVPSKWYENSPLTIHEAYMAGIPVITSNIGGMAELVPDGVSGVQFEVGNSRSLRGALEMLCAHPERLEEMRAQVPAVKSMAEHVPEIVAIYERAIAEIAGTAAAAGRTRVTTETAT